MDADQYTRMSDEERAEFLRRRHVVAVAVTAAVTVVMLLVTLVLIDHYADTPMCGTGQDYGPC
ncbi:hypothetical protein OG250_17880 [Streptomyces sp. NBC_00487]|uniref:hypothetical protein n=1 Tax=unclassified Streptomyces TaxID=2593676 RepID=UPI002DDB4B99|nr:MULTISPECIES: hypothetical protein [unclassified Streptomyces]WRY96574.1 hypothetical protein OG889_18585 [Streptomyces sp. NBC_00481]